MANFVYVAMDEKSKEAMVVDSGWEIEPIVKSAEDLGAKVKFAVATHAHFDHVSTLRELAESVGAKVVAHESSPMDCDLRLSHGRDLRLGSTPVRVLHSPGHTEDSICLYDGRNLFTGDTLFVGTIGRFEKERAEEMYNSLNKVILALPGNILFYPGHDYGEVGSRTLAEEKSSNPFLMPDDFRSFLSLFG